MKVDIILCIENWMENHSMLADSIVTLTAAIIGGIITLVGVSLTIRYYRKRDEENLRQSAMPYFLVCKLKISQKRFV